MSKKRKSYSSHAKRPVDKELIYVKLDNASTVSDTSELITATFPGTITGLRWEAEILNGSDAHAEYGWAIVHVQDGNAPKALTNTDEASFYQPEQNVLAFGTGALGKYGQGDARAVISGHTKTMRKLKQGDQMFLVLKNFVGGVGSIYFRGIVQFFNKT